MTLFVAVEKRLLHSWIPVWSLNFIIVSLVQVRVWSLLIRSGRCFTRFSLIKMVQWMLWVEWNIKVSYSLTLGSFIVYLTQILTVRNDFSLELHARIGAQLTFEEVSKHLFALRTVSQTHAEDVVAAEEICGWKPGRDLKCRDERYDDVWCMTDRFEKLA